MSCEFSVPTLLRMNDDEGSSTHTKKYFSRFKIGYTLKLFSASLNTQRLIGIIVGNNKTCRRTQMWEAEFTFKKLRSQKKNLLHQSTTNIVHTERVQFFSSRKKDRCTHARSYKKQHSFIFLTCSICLICNIKQ